MANEETKDNNDGEGEQGGGANKKRIILFAVLILVLIGLSVGGTIAVMKFLGGNSQEAEIDSESVGEGEEKEEPLAPAKYYPIKPPIIVSYNVRGRQRFLQAELTLLIRDEDVIPALELHMPMIRNSLNLIIGGQVYEDLKTPEGKELLRQRCLQELQKIMIQEIDKPGIEQVLFTNFVMQ